MIRAFRVQLRLAATLLLFAGCATLPDTQQADLRGDSLENGERLVEKAKKLLATDDARGVYWIRAAEIGWTNVSRTNASFKTVTSLSPERQRALRLFNEATAGIAPLLVTSGGASQTYSFAGYSYRLEPATVNRRGEHQPSEFEAVISAEEVPRKLCRDWYKEEGIGAPLAPQWRKPTDEARKRFVPSLGYSEPITAVVRFSPGSATSAPRTVRVGYIDPRTISRVEIGGTDYPLAADFTAPIVDRYRTINELWLGLTGLLGSDNKEASLAFVEPYDPNRIPVILVHGLNSHPLMWRDVVNELRADPELRDKYQYWAFYYPTGWPPSYSALRFRQELDAIDKAYGRQHNMVLVGHSMGGIVSRLQVISPGRALWNAQLGAKADQLYQTLPPTHLTKQIGLFQANPEIGREVYICVPHRGSKMADWSIVGFFTKLIKLPANILRSVADLGVISERRHLSSVNRLSPANPLYPAMDKIPIQVPYHSIIGDRGKGDTPNSSDGVVEYWSSHLKGAQSELIVPGPHGSYDKSETIAELKRILHLHLKRSARQREGEKALTLATVP